MHNVLYVVVGMERESLNLDLDAPCCCRGIGLGPLSLALRQPFPGSHDHKHPFCQRACNLVEQAFPVSHIVPPSYKASLGSATGLSKAASCKGKTF